MVIRVECRHRVGFGVVVEHVARICDDVHPVVAVDCLLGFRKIQSFSCLCSETLYSLAGWLVMIEYV